MGDQLLAWAERSHVNLAMVFATVAIAAAAMVGILLLNRVLRRIIGRAYARRYLPYETLLTVTRVITAGLWFITGLVILDLWGVSVGGLWTLLISAAAIIGVGFLAVWTIVSNVTASLFLTIWRPFHLGQTIELLPENLKGRVIDRNMMFTALRDEGGNVLQVPNNFFFQKMFRVDDDRKQSLFEILERENSARSR
jgi:small-conductance mechanosensitive channel